jgi:hypothetical protein
MLKGCPEGALVPALSAFPFDGETPSALISLLELFHLTNPQINAIRLSNRNPSDRMTIGINLSGKPSKKGPASLINERAAAAPPINIMRRPR